MGGGGGELVDLTSQKKRSLIVLYNLAKSAPFLPVSTPMHFLFPS